MNNVSEFNPRLVIKREDYFKSCDNDGFPVIDMLILAKRLKEDIEFLTSSIDYLSLAQYIITSPNDEPNINIGVVRRDDGTKVMKEMTDGDNNEK